MTPPDPELSEHAASIERSLARAAQHLTPEDFAGLIGDPGLFVLRSTMRLVEADSMSVWIVDPEREHLVVTHTEPDPAFLGWRQPLSEGLITLTFASEHRLCENQVYLNQDHSKKVDEALSQVTCAMMATPFYLAGNLRGVVSCVQLKDSPEAPDPPGFSARCLNRLGHLSTVLERLANYRLLNSILDLEI